jgi:hypothetical protein
VIPQSQLADLRPLHEQIIRERMVKSKRTISFKKGRLTKRARQWASYIERIGISPKYPQGEKSYGNKPMSERKNNG